MEPLDKTTAIVILLIIIYLIICIFSLFTYYLVKFRKIYKEFPRKDEYLEIISHSIMYGLTIGSFIFMTFGGLYVLIYKCIISI